jgi:hypothetical protein
MDCGACKTCTPRACGPSDCGNVDDGCGGTTHCAPCACVPKTCLGEHQLCGQLDTGCNGVVVECGTIPCAPADVDDPALADPSRATLPYECAGTTSLTGVNAWFSAGQTAIGLESYSPFPHTVGLHWIFRNCNPSTGCSAWTYISSQDSWGDFPLEIAYDASEALHMASVDGTYVFSDKVVTAPEFQMNLWVGNFYDVSKGGFNTTPSWMRFAVRMYSPTCISLASKIFAEPADASGTHRESAYVSTGRFSSSGPIDMDRHLPSEQPTGVLPACTGSPLSNAQILTHFSAGASKWNVNGQTGYMTRMCENATGCSKWVSQPSTGAIQFVTVAGGGVAVTLSPTSSCSISNGAGACDGWSITVTDGCVSMTKQVLNDEGALVQDQRSRSTF